MKNTHKYNKVAVIGCGLIGYSWAVTFARNGLEVYMYNRKSNTLATVKDRINEALCFLADESVIRKDDIPSILDRIHTTDKIEVAIAGADYIQECLWEDLTLKQEYFKLLTDLTPGNVPIGSSCSGLRISDITANVINHPERCIVAHPTNPPHLIPFMEISGDMASQEIKDEVFAFFESIGQKPIQCKEVYGYVLNRLQLSLIQEALYLVKEDICSVAAVDRALTDGLGLRWAFTGPYGVEELNSSCLSEGLDKYKDYMIHFFTEEQRKVIDYDQSFINKCVDGFKPIMGDMDHEEYLLWRDQMVTRTRLIKER